MGEPLQEFQGVLRGVPTYVGQSVPADGCHVNDFEPDRTLILATRGRDAVVAKGILREAHLNADVCSDVAELRE